MIICFLIIKSLYIISHNYVYILITSMIQLSTYIVIIYTQHHKKGFWGFGVLGFWKN
jgi:hypothetical protein